MTIKIKITNQLTGEIVTDNIIEVESNYATFKANHKCMAEAFPDCEVLFSEVGTENFICSMPINQMKDEELMEEGKMIWEDYMAKWYSELPA